MTKYRDLYHLCPNCEYPVYYDTCDKKGTRICAWCDQHYIIDESQDQGSE